MLENKREVIAVLREIFNQLKSEKPLPFHGTFTQIWGGDRLVNVSAIRGVSSNTPRRAVQERNKQEMNFF